MRALLLTVLLLFQFHWIDDVAKPEADTAGIAVSSIASVALVVGFATRARVAGGALLGCALAFVAFVSVADLIGMKPDGSRFLRPARLLGVGVGLAARPHRRHDTRLRRCGAGVSPEGAGTVVSPLGTLPHRVRELLSMGRDFLGGGRQF